MLQIKNLSKQYCTSKRYTVDALKDIDITLGDTGLVMLTGKSGSGKTTLLNMLGTFDIPSSGSILYGNAEASGLKGQDQNDKLIDITSLKGAELNSYRNRTMGIVFQNYNLISDWNVEDNIKIALEQLEWEEKSPEEIAKRVRLALHSVDLDGMENRKISELSGGQQQRVAIARAIIKQPSILLADEPTGNLDDENGRHVMEIFKRISAKCLVIIVTHDIEYAQAYADRVITMRDGTISNETTKADSKGDLGQGLSGENSQLDASQPDTARSDASQPDTTQSDTSQADTLQTGTPLTNARICSLPNARICHLALSMMREKKIKLIFMMLSLVLVLALLEVGMVNYKNQFGKIISDYFTKESIPMFSLSHADTLVSEEGYEYQLSVKNDEETRSLIASYTGEENLLPVIEGVDVAFSAETDDEFENNNYDLVLGMLDLPFTLLGRNPENGTECVVTEHWLLERGLSCTDSVLGKQVTVNGTRMTIVGIWDMNLEERYGDPNYYDADDVEANILYAEARNDAYRYGYYFFTAENYGETMIEEGRAYLPYSDLARNHMSTPGSENKNLICSADILTEEDLLWGRLPEAENEIVISDTFSVKERMDWEELTAGNLNGTYSFLDIGEGLQGKSVTGYLNLCDYLPDVTIVGVTDGIAKEGDIFLSNGIFTEISADANRNHIGDYYFVRLTGKSRRAYQLYEKLYREDIQIEEYRVYSLYNRLDESVMRLWGVIACLMHALLFVIMISFFSMNVHDNRHKVGILRAIGLDYSSIVRIWLVEALLLGLLVLGIASAITGGYMLIYNLNFQRDYGYLSSWLHINGLYAAGDVALYLILLCLTVLMPLWLMADKKPIELIRKNG